MSLAPSASPSSSLSPTNQPMEIWVMAGVAAFILLGCCGFVCYRKFFRRKVPPTSATTNVRAETEKRGVLGASVGRLRTASSPAMSAISHEYEEYHVSSPPTRALRSLSTGHRPRSLDLSPASNGIPLPMPPNRKSIIIPPPPLQEVPDSPSSSVSGSDANKPVPGTPRSWPRVTTEPMPQSGNLLTVVTPVSTPRAKAGTRASSKPRPLPELDPEPPPPPSRRSTSAMDIELIPQKDISHSISHLDIAVDMRHSSTAIESASTSSLSPSLQPAAFVSASSHISPVCIDLAANETSLQPVFPPEYDLSRSCEISNPTACSSTLSSQYTGTSVEIPQTHSIAQTALEMPRSHDEAPSVVGVAHKPSHFNHQVSFLPGESLSSLGLLDSSVPLHSNSESFLEVHSSSPRDSFSPEHQSPSTLHSSPNLSFKPPADSLSTIPPTYSSIRPTSLSLTEGQLRKLSPARDPLPLTSEVVKSHVRTFETRPPSIGLQPPPQRARSSTGQTATKSSTSRTRTLSTNLAQSSNPWIQRTNKQGKAYYLNIKTGESLWENPTSSS